MQAGKLNKRVTLQSAGRVQDPDSGAMVPGWLEVRKQWASIEPLSANAFIAAQSVQSKVSVRIVMRYRDDINTAWRIVHKGRIYNIEGALPDADSGREYITLPCSEGVNSG
ncbi:phage head closure protein [Halopseudomonas laoshanensis]|uniref:phage head closure protein n=1 Tax=Halopseudomonas laoshanensis TaxID=2268758 RepID=UPI003734EB79